jgi:hypothetical protein
MRFGRVHIAVTFAALFFGSMSAQTTDQSGILSFTHISIGCREQPLPTSREVSLIVSFAEVRENSLFANILVSNRSRKTIVVPRSNPSGQYWDARIYDSKGELISYCGGIITPSLEWNLLGPADVIEVPAGASVELQHVYLAPFWSYLWESDHDAATFEISYTGGQSFEADVPKTLVSESAALLRAQRELQCSLYPRLAVSARVPVPHQGG